MELVGLGLSLLVLVVLLVFGVPVAFSLLASSVTAFIVFLPPEQISVIGSVLSGSIGTSTLAAVPLFILMGEIFSRSGLSKRAYNGMSGALERLPGGMLHTNIAASAVFAAASGSSVGTTAAIGRAAAPELNARNYPRELTYGSLVAGGTLGILIPPSLAFIVFGVLTGTSIGQLFMAGVFPGIALVAIFALIIILFAMTSLRHKMPQLSGMSAREIIRNLMGVIPLVVVVIAVIGSLYFGIATTTEAGAVGAIAMFAIALPYIFRKRSSFGEALRSTVATTGMVLTILMSSALLSYVLTASGVSARLVAAAESFGLNKILLGFALFVIMLIMGMFLDPTSILSLLLPIVFPISQALDVNALWLAVFMVINLEMGLITPPVGLNLFVIKSVDPSSTWSQIIRGAIPFVVAMGIFLIILTLFPGIATWLPDTMAGR